MCGVRMTTSCSEKTYQNSGNLPLIELLDRNAVRILDVGCGAGDNAALIKRRYPGAQVSGITVSPAEARLAAVHLDRIWTCNIEEGFPGELADSSLDAIIFSHVLEHLRDPASVVAGASALLRAGGCMLIAVPNVVSWRQRFNLLLGNFQYEQGGIMDETHLRFFTFFTADQYLLAKATQIACEAKRADGHVPLSVFRRYVFPSRLTEWLDRAGSRAWPNLFGSQVLLKCRKRGLEHHSGTRRHGRW